MRREQRHQLDSIQNLIDSLKQVENQSVRKSQLAGLKIAQRGISTVVGPIAGFASKIFFHNPIRSLQNDNDEQVQLTPDVHAVVTL